MENEVLGSKYAGWLEELVKAVVDQKPKAIGMCMICPDDSVLTAYFEADCTDKAVMAHHIHLDSVWDMIRANAKKIVRLAQEQEDEH